MMNHCFHVAQVQCIQSPNIMLCPICMLNAAKAEKEGELYFPAMHTPMLGSPISAKWLKFFLMKSEVIPFKITRVV